MKTVKIINTGSPHLTLLFAGWGMDTGIAAGITHHAGDLAIVYDYRNMYDFQDSIFDSYSEVSVIAWSFGVYAASRVLPPYDHIISRRIAVNGTMRPIDDRYGIPNDVFAGTLANLNERNLQKFYRRMCGSTARFTEFIGMRPQRSLSEQTEELSSFGMYVAECPEADFRWDFAVIGKADAIFPVQAQIQAWQLTDTSTIITEEAHLPSLQKIIDRFIIDKKLVAERFAKARTSYDDQSQIQRTIADHLWNITRQYLSATVSDILEVGCGSGYLASLYSRNLPDARIELWDLVDYGFKSTDKIRFSVCDAEDAIRTVPADSFDLIISASTIQWFNNPDAFIYSALNALRPGGILAVSTFSPDNLKMFTDITGSGLPVPTAQALLKMAATHNADILYMHEECLDIDFESPYSMMSHLSGTGVTGLHHSAPLTTVRRILSEYPRLDSGYCRLTYTPIYLIARKK